MNSNNPIQSKFSSDIKDSYEKGFLFEQFIVMLFNERHFHLQEWRQSKKVDDISTLINHGNPDLELIFSGSKKYRFAVECKWKAEFKDGKIEWASKSKIDRYTKFENEKRIPVFVAIGIGGEPSNPEKLFVTPLCNISNQSEVYESALIPYSRKPSRRFFFDTVQLRLW